MKRSGKCLVRLGGHEFHHDLDCKGYLFISWFRSDESHSTRFYCTLSAPVWYHVMASLFKSTLGLRPFVPVHMNWVDVPHRLDASVLYNRCDQNSYPFFCFNELTNVVALVNHHQE